MRPDPFKGGTLTTMYEQHWPLHFVCGVEGRHCVVDSGGLRLEHLGTISVSVFYLYSVGSCNSTRRGMRGSGA